MAMIHELVKRFGLNKSTIAKKAGFSPGLITAIEKGERSPRSALMELEKFYNGMTHKNPAERPIMSADGALEKLNDLKHKDPAAYQLAVGNIDFLLDRASSGPAEDSAEKIAEDIISYVKRPRKARARGNRKASPPSTAPVVSTSSPAQTDDPK